ncbi:UNVERIFIED_CONTAM: hypothetical protein FKN15_010309 [Acipenser sinensis]
MKLLNFRDKERILRLAREIGELYYNGKRIFLFPDFSIELQNKRKEFDRVKRKLNEKEIKYALMYQAKLRVEYKARRGSSFHHMKLKNSFGDGKELTT